MSLLPKFNVSNKNLVVFQIKFNRDKARQLGCQKNIVEISRLKYKPISFFNIHPDYISCAGLFSIKLSLLHSVFIHKVARHV